MWPTATNSAYLATYNLFNGGSGAELCAYDRAAMLAGAPAVGLCFTGLTTYSYLPSDVDGPTPPLDGTPGYFVDLLTTSSLGVYKIAPNFATKTATLTPNSISPSSISVAAFSQGGDIPQPGTTMTLDSLNDRLMYRLAFRMFADHEAMAVTHSVSSVGVTAPRWYELRSPVATNGTFSVFQQGTFSVGDGSYRWMGSIAMDRAGDMGLGYSVSGPSQFPSIRYTGRVPGDAAGTMESEASLREGSGSQTGTDRWGDYSSMQIDPSDDCTFWYVNEYLPNHRQLQLAHTHRLVQVQQLRRRPDSGFLAGREPDVVLARAGSVRHVDDHRQRDQQLQRVDDAQCVQWMPDERDLHVRDESCRSRGLVGPHRQHERQYTGDHV